MVDNSPGLGLLPATLNALWWGLGGGRDAKIMLSNTSGDSVTADVFLDFQGERHASAPLIFSPHETKVLSVIQLLGELKASPAQAPEGGITIVGRSARPVLIAQGKITDVATGFSTSLNFMDPALQKANALHASGVPIGLPSKSSPYAGTGVFIPHVIIRNLTGSPQNVTITVEYPGEKGPQQTALAPVALGPYSTQDVSLDSAFDLLPLPLPYCSIRIQYSGPPGTVIGEVSSVESKGDMVIDSRLANERDGWAGAGGHPWHLDEETESVMFLTNMGEKPSRIGFDVVAGGTHYYLTRLKLRPHETQAIDLRKLRDAQKADFKGNKIPAAATDGSVIWSRLDHVPVMGRLLVLQRHKGISSNYDCGICDCPANYAGLEVDPYSVTVTVGGTATLDAVAEFDEHCNSYYWYCSVPASWTSLSPSIATVDDGGDVTGQSGGIATIRATYCDYTYTYDSQIHDCVEHLRTLTACGTVKVYPYVTSISPTYARVGSNNVQITINGEGFASSATVNLPSGFTLSGTCSTVTPTQIIKCVNISVNRAIQSVNFTVTNNPGTSNSVPFVADGPKYLKVVSDTWSNNARSIEYAVTTLAGQLVPGIPIGEVVSTSNYSCTQQPPPTIDSNQCGGGLTTDLYSHIPDSWRFPSGYTPVGCGLDITDRWQWCGSGAPTGGWTIGSPTGYIHNNGSKINGYVMPGNPMPPGLVIPP